MGTSSSRIRAADWDNSPREYVVNTEFKQLRQRPFSKSFNSRKTYTQSRNEKIEQCRMNKKMSNSVCTLFSEFDPATISAQKSAAPPGVPPIAPLPETFTREDVLRILNTARDRVALIRKMTHEEQLNELALLEAALIYDIHLLRNQSRETHL